MSQSKKNLSASKTEKRFDIILLREKILVSWNPLQITGLFEVETDFLMEGYEINMANLWLI